jgi:hypothetical protein
MREVFVDRKQLKKALGRRQTKIAQEIGLALYCLPPPMRAGTLQ